MPRYKAPFHPGEPDAISPELAEKLLSVALSSGGDYADLYFEYTASGSITLEDEAVKNASRSVSLGLGVRVQAGEATGYAFTETLDDSAMLTAARTAGYIAVSGSSRAPQSLPSPTTVDTRYPIGGISLDTSGKTKVDLLRRADCAARRYDNRIQRVQASFSERHEEILIATSDGIFAHDVRPLIRFGIHVVAEDGDKRQSGSAGGGGRVGLEYFLLHGRTPEAHGQEAARVAIAMLDAVEAPAGELPVILAPGDSGILLHEAVGHGLEADFNRKKTSNYSDRVGQAVASSLVTVIDDPTYSGGRGSINIDDEGQPTGPSTLIHNGVLCGYMQDRLSARHFKVPSCNGRRESFRAAPMPRMTNTIMLGGPHTAEEIIAATPKGIFARRFSGGQVNISNGDFVFSLTESYLVENGRITAPLKGVNLIGNGPEALSRVDMLAADVELSDGIWTCGKDGQSVPVGVGCPTIRVSHMTIGGTQVG
ncbi:MAG: metalloprotease TldD [Myxococcales bacterium]|nr:metalloprotease TldD [Myxococcales bacterium]